MEFGPKKLIWRVFLAWTFFNFLAHCGINLAFFGTDFVDCAYLFQELTSNSNKIVLKIQLLSGDLDFYYSTRNLTLNFTYFKELSTKLWPNLKAAVAKTFVMDGFTLSSYCLLNPESAGFIWKASIYVIPRIIGNHSL